MRDNEGFGTALEVFKRLEADIRAFMASGGSACVAVWFSRPSTSYFKIVSLILTNHPPPVRPPNCFAIVLFWHFGCVDPCDQFAPKFKKTSRSILGLMAARERGGGVPPHCQPGSPNSQPPLPAESKLALPVPAANFHRVSPHCE